MTRVPLAEDGRNMTPAEMDALTRETDYATSDYSYLSPEEIEAEAREAAAVADWDADDFREHELASWDAIVADELDPVADAPPPRIRVTKVGTGHSAVNIVDVVPDEDEDDAAEAPTSWPAPKSRRREDDEVDHLAFAPTIVDEIEDVSEEELACFAEKYPAADEDAAEDLSKNLAVRPPLTPEETDRRESEEVRKAREIAEKASKALALNPAWGLQRPFDVNDEIKAKLVTMGDTYLSALERIQLLLRDRVAFRDSGEAMIWTDGRVWLDNPRFEAELHKLLNQVIRAIKLVEMPARREKIESSGDYKLAERDLERAKLSGDAKKIREAEKDLRDLEAAVLGGVEKMWRRLEDMSPGTLVRDAIAHLRAECHVPDKLWSSGGWKLNFRDVTVDVYSGEQWAHRREDYLTHLIDLDFEKVEGARNDDVDAIFARVPDAVQPGVRGLLRRYFGSMLVGSVGHKCFLYLWGENNSGKSTIVKAAEASIAPPAEYGLGAALIREAGPEAFQKLSGDSSKSFPRHDLRPLRGVWVDEAQDVSYDSAFLNRMTNPAGTVTTQPLFAKKGDRVVWTPGASIILVGNRAGGIPMQEGVQRRMLVVKSGERLADGEFDVTAPAGADKADLDIVKRLAQEPARAAMLWQMILGARELGEVGDRGAMEGECAGWLNEGRVANSEDAVDARAIWLRDFVEVVEEDEVGGHPDDWFYSLQEAFAEVQALNAGYLRANNAFDRVTDKSLSEFLATKGFKKVQARRVGKRVYGYPRLRRRPINAIPSELQEYSMYSLPSDGREPRVPRVRKWDLVSAAGKDFSDLPREELEAMLAEVLKGGTL